MGAYSKVGSDQDQKNKGRIERLARDKHSSLIDPFTN